MQDVRCPEENEEEEGNTGATRQEGDIDWVSIKGVMNRTNKEWQAGNITITEGYAQYFF